MGSWHGTCGLSQLPIKEGDNIVLFPLLKDKHADNGGAGFTYSHNQYAPIAIPLFGQYNDYGGIDHITKNGAFLFTLFQEAVGGEEGAILAYNKKEYERQEAINSKFTGTPKDVNELLDVYMREPVYAGVGYMLVLEEVYQKVVEEVASRTKYRTKETLREKYTQDATIFLEEVAEKLQTPLDVLYEEQTKLREAADKDSDENFEKRMSIQKHIMFHYGNYNDVFSGNDFVDFFTELGKSNYMFNKLLLKALAKTPKEAQTQLVNEYVDLMLFDTVLDLTRKLWTPQAGAGSQGSECYLHKLIAESVIVREQKEIDEWFEENIAEKEEDITFGKNVTKETIW